MNSIRRTARRASGLLGRESWVIRALRPAYNFLLDCASGGRGIWQPVNGRERFRISPWYRHLFPEHKDPAVCAYLRDRVRPGAVCLNVGAHVGFYTLCLAEWAGPTGRVIAFEPNPAVRRILDQHVALNGLQGRVEVRPEAVSAAPGRTTFQTAGTDGVSRLDQPNADLPASAFEPITVDVTTIDQACGQRGVQPDWVVVDIEGYEVQALEGARHTVRAGAGRLGLVVEIHPNAWGGRSRADFEGLLAELGLRPVPLTGQADPLGEYGIVALESRA